ncbi:unnamed protein product [Camellia sinensis]
MLLFSSSSTDPNSDGFYAFTHATMFPSKLGLFAIIISIFFCATVESTCSKGCDLALASYYVWPESNLTFISEVMSHPISDILSYNPQIPNQDSVKSGIRIIIPFPCDCINGDFFAHVFKYRMRVADTYGKVAGTYYANLTTTEWVRKFNSYDPNRIPDGVQINVTVNCSCGDSLVSKDYGLFMTYPLRPEDSLDSIATETNLTTAVLKSYNPDANFSAGSGLVYIPAKDKNGTYLPLNSSSTRLSVGVIAGISIAGVAGALVLAVGVYVGFYRKTKVKDKLLSSRSDDQSLQVSRDPGSALEKGKDSTGIGSSPGLHTGLTVDKSVEFSYEELANATNDFSIAYKIGEGGFGAVYYAELRGEKAAIKKMDMQASKEFLAELKVLTHVHHLNLHVSIEFYLVCGFHIRYPESPYSVRKVRLIGEHLRGGRDPLPWPTRVQIALDSARGLEYIHEHTVPVYIHRDIKSANILIDKNYRGKVADFGLTKLTEVGSTSLPTRLVGTFGYMPPEYAQYGDVSPKIDVYAFGVVLYELISAKEAIVKASESMPESRGLVGLFDEVLTQPDPGVDLPKLVDPRLGDNYPLDSVRKMAQLAKACTQENPQLRPSMRSIVVALMTLSSTTEDWDIGAFYENQTLVNLMSGR